MLLSPWACSFSQEGPTAPALATLASLTCPGRRQRQLPGWYLQPSSELKPPACLRGEAVGGRLALRKTESQAAGGDVPGCGASKSGPGLGFFCFSQGQPCPGWGLKAKWVLGQAEVLEGRQERQRSWVDVGQAEALEWTLSKARCRGC